MAFLPFRFPFFPFPPRMSASFFSPHAWVFFLPSFHNLLRGAFSPWGPSEVPTNEWSLLFLAVRFLLSRGRPDTVRVCSFGVFFPFPDLFRRNDSLWQIFRHAFPRLKVVAATLPWSPPVFFSLPLVVFYIFPPWGCCFPLGSILWLSPFFLILSQQGPWTASFFYFPFFQIFFLPRALSPADFSRCLPSTCTLSNVVPYPPLSLVSLPSLDFFSPPWECRWFYWFSLLLSFLCFFLRSPLGEFLLCLTFWQTPGSVHSSDL